MKFQDILFLSAVSGAMAAPQAPAPAPAPAQRLLCSGLANDNLLEFSDIQGALQNSKDALQLTGGFTDELNTQCVSSVRGPGPTLSTQKGVWITYAFERDPRAEAKVGRDAIVCNPQSDWKLNCNPN
ncbi:hypothetical protein LZ30DRAFT_782810 [Colletotrichum cereale]|nr:hypothetical protein LZ30DRAFT_782810 [Colletotrichum cereale]